jgi:hypothetical protein
VRLGFRYYLVVVTEALRLANSAACSAAIWSTAASARPAALLHVRATVSPVLHKVTMTFVSEAKTVPIAVNMFMMIPSSCVIAVSTEGGVVVEMGG